MKHFFVIANTFIISILLSASLQAAPLCSDIFISEKSQSEILISKTEVNSKVFDFIQTASKTLDVSISSIPNASLAELLLMKAQQGVKIRLILDGRHFQKNTDIVNFYNKQVRLLTHPNIEIKMTSPLSLAGNRKYPGAVLHRKIVIVDGKKVYVGSSNLTDNQNNVEIGYFTQSQNLEILKVFDNDFKNVENRSFNPERPKQDAELKQSSWIGPDTSRPLIQKEILATIASAQKKLWINVYELTDPKVLNAIIAKKNSLPQLDIRILLNDEHVALWWGGKKYLHNTNEETIALLSKHGIPVRVYKDKGSILHARFMVTDDSAIAGSFDFTRRSFEGNIDLGFATKDPSSIQYITEQYAALWEPAISPTPSKFGWENVLGNFVENKVLPRLKVRAAPTTELKITYGWEVEFQTSESPAILQFYKLKSFSDKEWESLTLSERAQKLQQSVDRTPKVIRSLMSYFGLTYLNRLRSAPDFLPPKALLESHGTVELVGDVESNITDLNHKTKSIEDLIGKGYWQSHVVFPKIHTENISGWISFTSDFALLGHLEASYKSYLKDSKVVPGSVLSHYALGPLDAKTFAAIKKRETRSTKGQSIGSGGSDRLIYGPALRDDAYPNGLVGVELRQFSKRRVDLMNEVQNLSVLMTKNQLFLYNGFKETKMLDFKLLETLSREDQASWGLLLKELDFTIKKNSPNIVIGGAPYSLRFLLPLRDWESHPALQLSKRSPDEIREIQERIQKTRQEFIHEVNGIIAENYDGAHKVELMKVAVARWAHNSHLSDLFAHF